MNCTHCGQEMGADNRFCKNCGQENKTIAANKKNPSQPQISNSHVILIVLLIAGLVWLYNSNQQSKPTWQVTPTASPTIEVVASAPAIQVTPFPTSILDLQAQCASQSKAAYNDRLAAYNNDLTPGDSATADGIMYENHYNSTDNTCYAYWEYKLTLQATGYNPVIYDEIYNAYENTELASCATPNFGLDNPCLIPGINGRNSTQASQQQFNDFGATKFEVNSFP